MAENRVIEVHGLVTLTPNDSAYRLSIEQIQKELPEEIGIGDLEFLTITEAQSE